MEASMVRYHRKCDEFSICCEVGEAGVIFLENSFLRKTLYQIVLRGDGKIGKIFNNNFTKLDSKKHNFVNLKEYKGHHTIFESYTPFFIYGFNTLDLNQDWDGKLVSDSFNGDDNSYLVCFKGNPIINGKYLKPREYAKLEKKYYDVTLNNSIMGIFTKL